MTLLNYFSPKSNLKYLAGLSALLLLTLSNNNKEVAFILFLSLMLIGFGILDGYIRNRQDENKLQGKLKEKRK